MAMKFSGAHVLLTGGSKGIGAHLARELARRGARLTLVARPSEQLEKMAREVGGEFVEADLSTTASHPGLVARAEALNGPVEVLVNNAGAGVTKHYGNLTAEDLAFAVTLDLLSPMELSRQVLPGMLARNRGTIANVGSLAGELASPTVGAYGSAKAGLMMHTLTLRRDLVRTNVNAMIFVVGAVPNTGVYDESAKGDVTAEVIKRFENVRPKLSPEGVAARMGRTLQKGVESGRNMTVVLPRSVSPLIRLRLVSNRILGGLLLGIDPRAPGVGTELLDPNGAAR